MGTAKKKIAYIVNSLNLGGTESLVVRMSLAYRNDFDIYVICLDEPGLWADILRGENIPVYCFWRQPGIDISISVKIAQFCRRNRIDLIHAHQCTPWFYGALSRLIHPRPRLLFEEHGRHYPEKLSRKKNIVNWMLIQRLTHRIVAVSNDVAKRLIRYEGISGERIRVVYNGTHPPAALEKETRDSLRSAFGFSENDFVVGAVGRLDPIKNLPMLLKALTKAKEKKREIRGLLIGDGPDLENLRKMAVSLHMQEEIVFAGFRSDATDLLQCMDLFVLCSFSEGTSMALLEAIAAGIPAVVTDVGGNPELISHNENGWVVPSNAENDLASAIQEAFSFPEKRKRMAQQAARSFHENFTFDRMLTRYFDLYHELVSVQK